jgi:hypothetical protein
MFLLYHSDGCNTSETVFQWCYVNDLHTTHAVVCWVTLNHDMQPKWKPHQLQPGQCANIHVKQTVHSDDLKVYENIHHVWDSCKTETNKHKKGTRTIV